MSDMEEKVMVALRHRLANGRHLHHRDCIHNMPPEEQVAMRGKSVEWWTKMVGPLPVQITPDDWECESPFAETGDSGASS